MKNWHLQSLYATGAQLAVTTAAPVAFALPQGMVGAMPLGFVGAHLPDFCQSFLPAYSKYIVFYQAATSVLATVAASQFLALEPYSVMISSLPVLMYVLENAFESRKYKKIEKDLVSCQKKLKQSIAYGRHNRLNEILKILSEEQAIDVPHLIWSPSDVCNASAWHRINAIIVTSGLIDYCNDLDQVVGVIAHELGHLVKGKNHAHLMLSNKAHDYFKMCLMAYCAASVSSFIFLEFNGSEFLSYGINVACQISFYFLVNKFCVGQIHRAEETRADLFAVNLLQQKEPMINLLLKLHQSNRHEPVDFSLIDLKLFVQENLFVHANNGSQMCEWFLTFIDDHPSNLQRINDIESWYEQDIMHQSTLLYKFKNIEEVNQALAQPESKKPVICLS